MSVLPKLPAHKQRQLDLEWEDLLDRHKFRGQHLLLHRQQQAEVEGRVRRMPKKRQAYLVASCRRSIENAGLLESSLLVRERFDQLALEYLVLWGASAGRTEDVAGHLKEIKAVVLGAIADLWKPDAERFERSFRPQLQADLDSLLDVWTSQARGLELARLRSSTITAAPQATDWESERVLREGNKALEQAREVIEQSGRPTDYTGLIDSLFRISAEAASLRNPVPNNPGPPAPQKQAPPEGGPASDPAAEQPRAAAEPLAAQVAIAEAVTSTETPEDAQAIAGSSLRPAHRPRKFSTESLDEALKLKLANRPNLEVARVLYGPTPSDGQRRGVSTVLKHHFPDQVFPTRVK